MTFRSAELLEVVTLGGSARIETPLISNLKCSLLQIAQSMQDRTELMRERNALLAFAMEDCFTDEDKKDRKELLRLMRKAHLEHMRKQAPAPAPEEQTNELVETSNNAIPAEAESDGAGDNREEEVPEGECEGGEEDGV